MQEGAWLMNINLTAQLYGLRGGAGDRPEARLLRVSCWCAKPEIPAISFTVHLRRQGPAILFQASATLFNTGTTP